MGTKLTSLGTRTARTKRSRLIRSAIFWSAALFVLLCAGLLVSLFIAVSAQDWEKRHKAEPKHGGMIVIQTQRGSAEGNGWVYFAHYECVVREFWDGAEAPPPLTGAEVSSLFVAPFMSSVYWRDDHFDAVNRAKGERETKVVRSGWPAYAMEFHESRITKGKGLEEPERWGLIYDGLLRCMLFWSASIGMVTAVVWSGCWLVPRVVRLLRGRCVVCGYELRGLEPGMDCPECGCTPAR